MIFPSWRSSALISAAGPCGIWPWNTCSSFAFLGKVRSKEIIRAYGADRLLFGDDFPMWDHKTEVETLLSLDLTDDEYEKIFSGNAKRLLRMTPNP